MPYSRRVRPDTIVLYFTTGHDELNCENSTPEGLSSLCEKLHSQNYEIRPIDLAQSKAIPRDATAVFILGLSTGFLDQESAMVEKYLNEGGSVFLALAPTAFKSEMYKNLTKLATPFGLKLGNDVVIDRLSTVGG